MKTRIRAVTIAAGDQQAKREPSTPPDAFELCKDGSIEPVVGYDDRAR